VWVTVVALQILLNDKYKLESLQDGSRTRQEIPQTAGCKARACNWCLVVTPLAFWDVIGHLGYYFHGSTTNRVFSGCSKFVKWWLIRSYKRWGLLTYVMFPCLHVQGKTSKILIFRKASCW